MSDQNYTTSFTVEATPSEVFNAINNVRGWWSTAIEGDAGKVGNEFVHDVPDVHHSEIRVTELVPGQRAAWRVLENNFGRIPFINDTTEWVNTEIVFEISESDGKTTVNFIHVGLVPDDECYELCSDAWGGFIRGSLPRLITTGTGHPMTETDRANAKKQLVG